jgi:two-component system NtrC family sensor kinase
MTLLDLNAILLEELSLLESDPFYRPELRKEIHLAPDLPRIQGVRSDFSVGFANILNNALHALWGREHPTLQVASRLDGDDVLVVIRDNGAGIDEEILPRIFEPFFSGKPLPSTNDSEGPTGTGLGLASAEQRLKRYGAVLGVESRPGQGTSFSIRIPTE